MAIFKKYLKDGVPVNQRFKYSDASNIGNEPIVQKDIPVSVDSSLQNQNVVTKRIDDVVRITTLLTQRPGVKYLANETALQALTIKNDPNKTFIGNKLAQIGNGLIETVKTIGSTLAQVPLNGTGTHFVKGFNGKSGKTYLSGLDTAPHATVNNGGLVSPVFTDLVPDTQRKSRDIKPEYSNTDSAEESGLARNVNPNKFRLKNSHLLTNLNLEPKLIDQPKPDARKETKYSLGDPSTRVQEDGDSYVRSLEQSKENNNIDLINFESGTTENNETTPQDFIKFKFKIITQRRKIIRPYYLEHF